MWRSVALPAAAGETGTFTLDRTVRQAIDEASTKAADSHIATMLEDLRQTVKLTMIAEGDISPIAAAVGKKERSGKSATVVRYPQSPMCYVQWLIESRPPSLTW